MKIDTLKPVFRPSLFNRLRSARLCSLALLALATACGPWARADYVFTHVAGPLGGRGNADGLPSIARFNIPLGIAIDPAGNLYVTDRDNHTIRKISPNGVVSTLGGAAGTDTVVTFLNPAGVAVDALGNVYVSDDSRETIYKITPSGTVATLAGMSYDHYYNVNTMLGISRDGTGTDARFFAPAGLAVDLAGNVFVADRGNHTIRKITPGGDVTTIAGTPGLAGSDDGIGAAARFSNPRSVSLDAAGNLIVADAKTVRKIAPDGTVTTLAGPAGPIDSGDGSGAVGPALNSPQAAVDGLGNIFVADAANNLIRKITPAGALTTLAGTAGQIGSADGTGSSARFNNPWGVTVDNSGNVYVVDSDNNTIRRITPSGVVTTFAGVAGGYGSTDGTGTNARFYQPWGVALDQAGNLFVADRGNNGIRKITPKDEVTTFVGYSGWREPAGVVVDPAGNVYSVDAGANTIRKITPGGVATTLAGAEQQYGTADGPGVTAKFAYPLGIAQDRTGNLYVADAGNRQIRIISPQGAVSTLEIQPSGIALVQPNGLVVDATGNLFVADRGNSTINKITPTGVMTIVAGASMQEGYADGTGSAARFNGPCGVALDSKGNLFVTDTGSNTIRKITPAGAVTTVGGDPRIYGSADGTGTAAHFYAPHGIAIDSSDNLYISEEWNHSIRYGMLIGPPVITTQPLSQTVTTGTNVQFSVVTAAVPAPTYQWYFNGNTFSGGTTNTLSFANARSTDAGDYTVVVTNSLGTVTSSKATLTVTAAPVITPPSTPTPVSGGGGSIEYWFALASLVLGGARRLKAQDFTKR